MRQLFSARRREIETCFGSVLTELLSSTHLNDSDSFIQHGDTTVLLHSVAVAFYSYKLCRRLGIRVPYRELVRGALLHDYFLYDWHKHDSEHGLHGFSHPATALANARRDTQVSATEANIIARHMFPLTPAPPANRAAWAVCLVDKICSVYETFNHNIYPELRDYIRRCRPMPADGRAAA